LRRFSVALVALFLLAFASSASAAPGDLDPSFGSGGVVKLLESNEESWAEGIAVQSDGKVVLAGGEKGNAVVLRLLPNGQPDPSFGSGGKVALNFPGGHSEVRAVALQPDGKIVVAGAAEAAGNGDFLIVRYNADGSPDVSFGGGDGIETVSLGNGYDEAGAVAIGTDGRIAATGTVDLPKSGNGLGVVVLEPNGTPDASFGGGGSVVEQTEIGEGDDRGEAVALLGGGRVLLGDSCGSGRGNGFVLLRLLSNGEPDPGFGGGDGIVETPIPGDGLTKGMGRITDFALLPDGRIIASGYGADYDGTPVNYHSTFAAVRYLPDGELDPSFGEGGIYTRRIDNEGAATSVELAQNGGYLFAGATRFPRRNRNWKRTRIGWAVYDRTGSLIRHSARTVSWSEPTRPPSGNTLKTPPSIRPIAWSPSDPPTAPATPSGLRSRATSAIRSRCRSPLRPLRTWRPSPGSSGCRRSSGSASSTASPAPRPTPTATGSRACRSLW
jgi:uncharacterized delta-60 repeat protein